MDTRILRETTFPPVDQSRWLELASKALKGADPNEVLVSLTDDRIPFGPLHQRKPNAEHVTRQYPQHGWSIVQRADDPDTTRANRQLHDDLANGANGVALVFSGAQNAFGYGLAVEPDTIPRLFDGINLDNLHIRLDAQPNGRVCADWLVEYLQMRRIDPRSTTISLGIDPTAVLASSGWLKMSIAAMKASLPQSLAGFFQTGAPAIILEADGRPYHNAGATEAQELGAMLSIALDHLRMFDQARQPIAYAAPHIGFSTSLDQDQFVAIAKLRALRRLWTRLQEACSNPPAATRIHAETSMRMMTSSDPETNILRTTLACFAGAVGGADTLSALPHTITHGLPDGFARRLARNTQLILANESHLAFVSDPGAGSGGIETLTDGLCEAAWNEFQRFESEGGVLQSLVDGKFHDRIAEAQAARTAAYRNSEKALVGTTIFPAAKERPVNTLEATPTPFWGGGVEHCEPLTFPRIDELLGRPAVATKDATL